MKPKVTVAEILAYRSLRAPREDRSILLVPSLHSIAGAVRQNILCKLEPSSAPGLSFDGEWLAKARREFVHAALAWTGSYTDTGWAVPCCDNVARGRAPLLLAGHQTEMFHPGVWFKNAVLSRAAQSVGGLGVNILIDADSPKTAAIRVPTVVDGRVTAFAISPDRTETGLPYEELFVRDWDCFSSFGERTYRRISHLVPTTMVREYWDLVQNRAAEIRQLAWSVAQARHLTEQKWGWRTLEIPQSSVCDLPSFAEFAALIWNQAEAFADVHNRMLALYRRIHKIRTEARPVPNLRRHGDWQETPFWIWSADQPRRRRMLVRRMDHCIQISDGTATLACVKADDFVGAASVWADLRRQGIKIRGRALITTMWARMILGDMFIHGIGGAKYDQVTDAIIQDFFGIRPPTFAVASATLQLPVQGDRAPARNVDDPGELRQKLRQIRYHPERFLDLAALPEKDREQATTIIGEKLRWGATPNAPENAAARYRAIVGANEALGTLLRRDRDKLLQAIHLAERQSRDATILTSREFAFCLYPEAHLQDFFQSQLDPSLA